MKGVAIPYIVGLLIALIVLAIAAFLLYLYVLKNKPLSCPECGAKFAAWCSRCYLKSAGGSWSGANIIVGTELETCVKECGYWTSPEDICDNAEGPCKGVGVPP